MKNVPFDPIQFSIMRTALLTAYPRTFSDIPYARAIFNATMSLADDSGFTVDPSYLASGMALEIEARYKSINTVLRRSAHDRIIELGSGLSPRGLEFCHGEFAATEFREVDLKPMIELKTSVYDRLNLDVRPALMAGDLADADSLEPAIFDDWLTDGPITVVSEGLFWYLSWEQKARLAQVIRTQLLDRGGQWITSDCPPPLGQHSSQQALESRNLIGRSVGLDIEQNKFRDSRHFVQYFEEQGFAARLCWLEDLVPSLTSPARLGISAKEVQQRLRSYAAIAVLECRSE